MYNATDTIAALSTPVGESGLAVIRVSGPGAVALVLAHLRSAAGQPLAHPEHRRLYHADLVDTDGARVDEVMVAFMQGPESYTGDDVVEISCHGGLAVVQRALDLLFAAGARPAQPGEFTRRAFLNGKMDLVQAEAVADLIHARSEIQRVAAERQLSGGLSRRIDRLADEMLLLLGDLEARIDFIEEGIEALDFPATADRIDAQRRELEDLLASAPMARVLHDGFRVVIAGPVNAGKSSLFNRLLGESRAIVTEIPGTTRDVLRETLVIDGIPFVLHDTAGLRGATTDRVEQMGIGRTSDAIDQADIVLFVLDGSERAALDPATRQSLAGLDASRGIVLINKADLPPAIEGETAGLRVSAVTGAGLDALRATMLEKTGSARLARLARDGAVLNARLAGLLRDARQQLDTLSAMIAASEPLELVAQQARQVLSLYEEATGRRYHEGLLDTIFSRFCIGK